MAACSLWPDSFWAKDLKRLPSLHNARGETIAEKPAFKKPYASRRCIIPAEAFYEWREEGAKRKKMPYRFSRKDGGLINFAGIWNFSEIDGEKIYSFSIVTGAPSEIMRPYHDRTPLITDDIDAWLDPSASTVESIRALPAESFTITAMNPSMNKSTVKEVEPL